MLCLVVAAALLCVVSADQRIYGGSAAAQGMWPFAAGVWFDETGAPPAEFKCGAALIHQNWVVSSAECLSPPQGFAGTFSVELGHITRGMGTVIGLSSVTMHPEFNMGSGSKPNDIAVARLATPADTTNPNIQPAVLGMQGMDWTTHTCYTVGWGRNCTVCNFPMNLQQVMLPVQSDDVCASRWSTYYNRQNHTCVWDSVNQDKIPCQGDEGTPLTCDHLGVWQLVGVGSWGDATCAPYKPYVSTLVEEYAAWICTATMGDVC